ncbi:hypothetical protein LTR06_006367, partial [Exophiala xenobiotica]
HKHILTKCAYFSKCLANGRFQESINNEINLPDDDPVGFAKVVGFLYTHKLYCGNDTKLSFSGFYSVCPNRTTVSNVLMDRLDAARAIVEHHSGRLKDEITELKKKNPDIRQRGLRGGQARK